MQVKEIGSVTCHRRCPGHAFCFACATRDAFSRFNYFIAHIETCPPLANRYEYTPPHRKAAAFRIATSRLMPLLPSFHRRPQSASNDACLSTAMLPTWRLMSTRSPKTKRQKRSRRRPADIVTSAASAIDAEQKIPMFTFAPAKATHASVKDTLRSAHFTPRLMSAMSSSGFLYAIRLPAAFVGYHERYDVATVSLQQTPAVMRLSE
jgi:hypothetical protein